MIAITGRDNNGDDGTTTWFVVDGEVYGVCVGNAKHPAARLLDSDGAPEDFRGQFSAVSAVAFEAMVAMASESTAWTFEGYWNAVLSPLSPERVVAEYELDPSDRRGLDEWLGTAEEAAAAAGGIEIPESWEPFHLRALDMLCAVAGGDEIAHEITHAVRELRRLIWAHADAEGPERAVIAAQIASLSKRTSIYRIPLNAGDVPPVGLHITLAQGGRDLERFEGDGELVIPACVNGHYYYAQHDAQSAVADDGGAL